MSAYQAIDGEQRQLRDVAYASANNHHRSSLMIPTIATFDLCLAAVASESAYTIVPELLSQNDRIVGIAIIGISQVNCKFSRVASFFGNTVQVHASYVLEVVCFKSFK